MTKKTGKMQDESPESDGATLSLVTTSGEHICDVSFDGPTWDAMVQAAMQDCVVKVLTEKAKEVLDLDAAAHER